MNIDLKKIEYEWASDFFVYHRWSRSRNMIAWVLFVKKCGGGWGVEQITIDQLQSLKKLQKYIWTKRDNMCYI